MFSALKKETRVEYKELVNELYESCVENIIAEGKWYSSGVYNEIRCGTVRVGFSGHRAK